MGFLNKFLLENQRVNVEESIVQNLKYIIFTRLPLVTASSSEEYIEKMIFAYEPRLQNIRIRLKDGIFIYANLHDGTKFELKVEL